MKFCFLLGEELSSKLTLLALQRPFIPPTSFALSLHPRNKPFYPAPAGDCKFLGVGGSWVGGGAVLVLTVLQGMFGLN